MNKEKLRLEELNKKTCKDCYHYEKCYFDALKESHLTGNDYREIVCIDNQIICKFFKDKSLIIELPCKVGKELFLTEVKELSWRLSALNFKELAGGLLMNILEKLYFSLKKKQKKG